ncbi:MAG: hypothetical protein JOS17DRAFT_599142 [Linnemannia elongata]|nr:MAG: hypothetical protein JOS17DRAFT_599142 [Linnemannia elongata]
MFTHSAIVKAPLKTSPVNYKGFTSPSCAVTCACLPPHCCAFLPLPFAFAFTLLTLTLAPIYTLQSPFVHSLAFDHIRDTQTHTYSALLVLRKPRGLSFFLPSEEAGSRPCHARLKSTKSRPQAQPSPTYYHTHTRLYSQFKHDPQPPSPPLLLVIITIFSIYLPHPSPHPSPRHTLSSFISPRPHS